MAIWGNSNKQQPKQHPDFPKDLPIGLRMGALVTVDETYWLLNSEDVATTHPGDNLVVREITKFGLFGLSIFRAYFDKKMDRFHQIHVDDEGNVLDGILFNLIDTVHPQNEGDWKNWLESLIGWKDITPPDGPQFLRDWKSVDDGFGDFAEPEDVNMLMFFDADEEPNRVETKCMLFSRSFGEDEWEYLLVTAVLNGDDPRILIHVGAPLPLDNFNYV
jgi:hypothetical protein